MFILFRIQNPIFLYKNYHLFLISLIILVITIMVIKQLTIITTKVIININYDHFQINLKLIIFHLLN